MVYTHNGSYAQKSAIAMSMQSFLACNHQKGVTLSIIMRVTWKVRAVTLNANWDCILMVVAQNSFDMLDFI